MSRMLKILILQDMPLFPYRIYAYNELVARGYNLTVLSVSNAKEVYDIPLKFKHIRKELKRIGPFVWIKRFSLKQLDKYEYIIVTPNMRVLNFFPLLGNLYKKKTLAWGHLTGRTANNKIAEKIRYITFKKFPALIFYEEGTKDEYIAHGFDAKKLFVANNTQYVDPTTVHPYEERTYFLYVGRIQERKGLDIALRAFARLKKQNEDNKLEFVFVGSGDTNSLKDIANEEGIIKSVRFLGSVHNQAKLGEWFSHAIAYVSPGHVGLGVLHSFACGVPVITCTGRLHSVEISNCNPDNSLVVPYTVEDVERAMSRLYTDKELQKKLAKAALKYYNNHCTIDKMVDGIDNALKYIIQK